MHHGQTGRTAPRLRCPCKYRSCAVLQPAFRAKRANTTYWTAFPCLFCGADADWPHHSCIIWFVHQPRCSRIHSTYLVPSDGTQVRYLCAHSQLASGITSKPYFHNDRFPERPWERRRERVGIARDRKAPPARVAWPESRYRPECLLVHGCAEARRCNPTRCVCDLSAHR
jgi:hypothetical protein